MADGGFTPQPAAKPHRTAPASLPCCVRPLLQFVFYDLVMEDDVFADVVRKGGLSTGFVVALVIPFSGAAHVQEVGVNPASIAFAITVLATSIGWLATFVLARCSAFSTLRLISAGMAVDCIATAVSTVTSATQHTHVTLLVLLIVVGVFDLPRKWIWYLLLLPPYLVGAYNQTARPVVHYDATPLFIDGATEFQGVESRMIHHCTHFAVCVMIASCVTALHTEYRRQLSRVNASSVLAAFVAEDLAAYRTVRARQLLEAAVLDPDATGDGAAAEGDPAADPQQLYAAAQEGGARAPGTTSAHVSVSPLSPMSDAFDAPITPGAAAAVRGADHALVDSLCTIVSNLEAYRPHLPNWLIDQAMIMPDPNGTEETGAAGGSTTTDGAGDDSSPVAGGGGRGDDASSVHADWGRRFSVSSDTQSSMRSGPSSRDGSARRMLSHHAPMQTSRSLMVARARVYFTVCAVRRPTAEELPGGVTGSPRDARHAAAAAANDFVDCVHVIARATKAAVHSFVGDTVEVTWNAAAPVPVPAAKAARFMARLRNTVADKCACDGLTVMVAGGAIVSKARIQLAGSGSGAGQQSLLCSSSKRAHQRLTTLSNAGRKYGVMLADSAVARDAVEMELRAVATLLVPARPSMSLSGVREDVPAATAALAESSMEAGSSSTSMPAAACHPPPPSAFAIAYEIVAEAHIMSDDWLYVVRGDLSPSATSSPPSNAANHAAVSAAFHKAADHGDFTSAEQQLAALPAEYVNTNAMVKRLVDAMLRAKEALAHAPDDAVAAKAAAMAAFSRAALLD